MQTSADVYKFLERKLGKKKSFGPRRVIFDTNVWAAIADNGFSQILVKCSKNNDIELQVAPATVYETMRFEDKTARDTRLKLMTNRAFNRLMPEAFLESLEVLLAILKYKPNWINSSPNLQRWDICYRDWTKNSGKGFWWRVRNQPDLECDILKKVEGDMLPEAREQWKAQRKHWREMGKDRPTFLDKVKGPGGASIEIWKWESYLAISNGIFERNNAYADWLLPFVSSPLNLYGSLWEEFWISSVQTVDVERQFLRAGVKYFQQSHRWSPGTPGDSQLATYWPNTDLFVSGDKSLLKAMEQCRALAPSELPAGKLIEPGAEGAEYLIEFLSRTETSEWYTKDS